MNDSLKARNLTMSLLFCFPAFVLFLGCGQKSAETTKIAKQAEAPVPKVASETVKKPPPAATPSPKAEAAAATYTIRVIPGAAKAGTEVTSRIEISPLPGYKMNLDFPSRLKVSPKEGVTLTKPVMKKEDADLTEEILRFKVPFTVAAAGSAEMMGTADFSVCNESSCKLYRGEQISWKVAVQ